MKDTSKALMMLLLVGSCVTRAHSFDVLVLRVGKAVMQGGDELPKEYSRKHHAAALLQISSPGRETTIVLTAITVKAAIAGGSQVSAKHLRFVQVLPDSGELQTIGSPSGNIVLAGIGDILLPLPQSIASAIFGLEENTGIKLKLAKDATVTVYFSFPAEATDVEKIYIGDVHAPVKPLDEKGKVSLAGIYMDMGLLDMAEKDLQKIIKENPKSSLAHQSLGECLIKLNRLDPALREISKAIALDPNSIWAYNSRATVYTLKNNKQAALDDWSRALELDPTNYSLNANKAQLLETLERPKEALTFYLRALESKPAQPFIIGKVSRMYFEQGDYRKAIQLISKNLAKGDENPDLLEIRGRSLIKLGEINSGVEDIVTAFDIFDHQISNTQRLVDLADLIEEVGAGSSLAFELNHRAGLKNGQFSIQLRDTEEFRAIGLPLSSRKKATLAENLEHLRKNLCNAYDMTTGVENPWPSRDRIRTIAPDDGMPATNLSGLHPSSSEIITVNKMDARGANAVLKDTGKWLYIADPSYRGLNRLLIDCIHKDSAGKRYADY